MGFDAKGLTETVGILRLAAVICTIVSWSICANAGYRHTLTLFIIGEIVFLVLGCFGLGENDIVKLVDKIFHLVAAILVIIYAITWAYDWWFFSHLFDYWMWSGGCIIAWFLILAVGIIFAVITSMIWK